MINNFHYDLEDYDIIEEDKRNYTKEHSEIRDKVLMTVQNLIGTISQYLLEEVSGFEVRKTSDGLIISVTMSKGFTVSILH